MGSHHSKSTPRAASTTSTSRDSKSPNFTESAAPASPEHRPTAGSRLSRGLSLKTRGHKLQPSQSKQDKEEMKEPPNYYSRRSKSLRRKAGVDQISGEGSGAGGGLGL